MSRTVRPGVAAAGAGALAALAGLAVAQLGVALLGPGSSPVVAVADQVIERAPAAVRERAIDVLGTADKPVLVTGVVVVLLALAAGLGIAARRFPRLVWGGAAVLLAAGCLAVYARPYARSLDLVPTIAGVLTAAASLDALAIRLPASPAPAGTAGPDRRGFLKALGGSAGVAVVAAVASRVLDRRRATALASRDAVRLPAPASPAPPVPAGADLSVPGVAPLRTPAGDFYRIDTALVLPTLTAESWSLRVHGMVGRELRLTYADLLARPLIERDITLSCVSNEVGGDLVSSGRWLGAPLAPLLAEARVRQDADQLVGRSSDGFTAGTPVATVLDGRDAMLAVGLDGRPLPLEHGFPVRMLVPGLYGYVSATKWLTELELTTFAAYDAFWVHQGWARTAPVKTAARIDTPRRRAAAGPVTIAGVAWAQHRGIARVEVQVDGDPWRDAELAAAIGPDTWRQWRLRWDATPGRHVLRVRATDGTGETQTGVETDTTPDGATGWHTIEVDVS